MSDLNMEVSSWSSAMVSSGQPGRLIRKGVTAFSFILAYLYPHSLFIFTFQAHMASVGRRLIWQGSEHPSCISRRCCRRRQNFYSAVLALQSPIKYHSCP